MMRKLISLLITCLAALAFLDDTQAAPSAESNLYMGAPVTLAHYMDFKVVHFVINPASYLYQEEIVTVVRIAILPFKCVPILIP